MAKELDCRIGQNTQITSHFEQRSGSFNLNEAQEIKVNANLVNGNALSKIHVGASLN